MYKSASLDLPTGCLINFINLNLPVRLLNQHLKHPLSFAQSMKQQTSRK